MKFSWFVFVGVLFCAALLVLWYQPQDPEVHFALQELGTSTSSASTAVEQHFRLYTDQAGRFSFLYPNELLISSSSASGSEVIAFQIPEGGFGFQVYIQPYDEPTISDKQFYEDVPSGVRAAVASTTVAGVPAVAFESVDAQLGETYEVWFIHGGYLYEVTTYRELATMINFLLESWEFGHR